VGARSWNTRGDLLTFGYIPDSMPNAYYFVELIQLKKRYLQQRHAVSDSKNITVYAYDEESVSLVAIAHKIYHLR